MRSAFSMSGNEKEEGGNSSRLGPSHAARAAKRSPAWHRHLGFLFFAGLALVHIAPRLKETQPDVLARPGPPLPAWVELSDPQPVFQLKGPQFPGAAGRHMTRRHRLGGGRQDIWQFTSADEPSALLDLLIYQPGKEVVVDTSFYVELTRRAAEGGHAILKADQPAALATKFGPFEVARIDLDWNGAARRPCMGFRYRNAVPSLRILGFACGESSRSFLATKAGLACFMDGIDLAPAAEDKRLIDFFFAHHALPNPTCMG